MATIKYATGFKYYFDVSFLIPATFKYTTVTMQDTLPLGLKFPNVLELTVTLDDGTPEGVEISDFSYTIDPDTGELLVSVNDPRVVTGSGVDRAITITFAVLVDENLSDGEVINIAYVWGDSDEDQKIDMGVAVDTKKSILSVETNSSKVPNEIQLPVDGFTILATLNGMDTHPTTNSDYVVTFTLAEELGSFGEAYKDEKYGIKAYLLTDIPTDITEHITDVEVTTRAPGKPAVRKVTLAHQEEFRNHQLYIAVPAYLAEKVDPMLTNPGYLHSDITATFMDLYAETVHTTTIMDNQVLKPGLKIIR